MLNLSVLLEDSARRYPTKDAFVFMDTHLNYAQVNGAANQIANGLKAMGIQPGDKIALSCLNDNALITKIIASGMMKSLLTACKLTLERSKPRE